MPGHLSKLPALARLPTRIAGALVAAGATFGPAPNAAVAGAPESIALPGDRICQPLIEPLQEL